MKQTLLLIVMLMSASSFASHVTCVNDNGSSVESAYGLAYVKLAAGDNMLNPAAPEGEDENVTLSFEDNHSNIESYEMGEMYPDGMVTFFNKVTLRRAQMNDDGSIKAGKKVAMIDNMVCRIWSHD
jgi:hypothetical protein